MVRTRSKLSSASASLHPQSSFAWSYDSARNAPSNRSASSMNCGRLRHAKESSTTLIFLAGETMKRMAPPPSLFPLHDPDVSRAIPCA